MNHTIVYCSPNGSTRHVAEVIADRLSEAGCDRTLLDIGENGADVGRIIASQNPAQGTCLWIGSPVYVDHPIPLIESFICRLPQTHGWYAAPFVTWGGVTSGTALYEMAQDLTRRGCVLIGAAKVIAVHSSLWRVSSPLGEHHPDARDDRAIQELVDQILKMFSAGPIKGMPLEELDYQSPAIKADAQHSSIASAKLGRPRLRVDEKKCIQCGQCAEMCPAQAITLTPFPQIGADCFICLKCVRECPQEAFPFDAHATEKRLRAMAVSINEQPLTQIFCHF
ncbi:MAG: EFR1 family ferrodoxin [Desulfosarcina sp.]